MKPYTDLSRAGKLRRLRRLAVEALSHYELRSPEVVYHGFQTNLFFQVTTASGERLMLRLASPGWRTLEDLRSEAMWLDALALDTCVQAPRIVPARSGERVLPMCGPGTLGTWNATLMTRIPGRLLGNYLTEQNLAKMGALFAELHHHAASWVPPACFSSRRFEHWLSRGEENVIIGDGREPAMGTLPSQLHDLLDRMHLHVESAYAAIDRSDLRVIHCDLWHDNIKLDCGILHPFDFEDTVWGYRAHDIAMAMLDLLETIGEERYPSLLAAFRRGYEAHVAWPENCIEPFQIGRLLWKLNWVARCQPQRLLSMVERHAPVFEHYEQTGRVVCPPAV